MKITLYGCDVNAYGYTSGSLLVDNFIMSPPVEHTRDYANFLCQICNQYEIDLLLSVFDDELELLTEIKDKIKTHIVLPDMDTIQLFRNKQMASSAIQQLGIAIPPIITSLFDESKVIFRPKVSIGSRGICVVDLSSEQYIPNKFNSNYFLQRFIDGNEYTVDIFADKDGIPKMIIPRQRLEIKQGVSFKCQIVKKQELIDACIKICEEYFLPGITNVQFITSNNENYFIELNPRMGGTAIAGILASFNYVELFLQNILQEKTLDTFDNYMKCVAWDSIITRYYEETIFHSGDSSSKMS